jgi:Domain of unknown function (DUF5615)
VIRLVADANLSRRFVEACLRLDQELPIVHLADWVGGKHRISKDPVLLEVLREHGMILITFDRRTMAMHAGHLTRGSGGHTGVILFRRSVSQMDYGTQSRLVVEFWKEASDWDWSDRIEYLPRA